MDFFLFDWNVELNEKKYSMYNNFFQILAFLKIIIWWRRKMYCILNYLYFIGYSLQNYISRFQADFLSLTFNEC